MKKVISSSFLSILLISSLSYLPCISVSLETVKGQYLDIWLRGYASAIKNNVTPGIKEYDKREDLVLDHAQRWTKEYRIELLSYPIDALGNTALVFFIIHGKGKRIKNLIDLMHDFSPNEIKKILNIKNKSGETIIIQAVEMGNLKIFRKLNSLADRIDTPGRPTLKAKIKKAIGRPEKLPNKLEVLATQDNHGNTALMHAITRAATKETPYYAMSMSLAQFQRFPAQDKKRYLLAHNSRRETALILAMQKDFTEIADILIETASKTALELYPEKPKKQAEFLEKVFSKKLVERAALSSNIKIPLRIVAELRQIATTMYENEPKKQATFLHKFFNKKLIGITIKGRLALGTTIETEGFQYQGGNSDVFKVFTKEVKKVNFRLHPQDRTKQIKNLLPKNAVQEAVATNNNQILNAVIELLKIAVTKLHKTKHAGYLESFLPADILSRAITGRKRNVFPEIINFIEYVAEIKHPDNLESQQTFVKEFLNKKYLGNTPLTAAARKGYGEIINLLIEKGADPTIANDEGKIWSEIIPLLTLTSEYEESDSPTPSTSSPVKIPSSPVGTP